MDEGRTEEQEEVGCEDVCVFLFTWALTHVAPPSALTNTLTGSILLI